MANPGLMRIGLNIVINEMFSLTAQELDNAFAAIQHHGYSAMLPAPPEWGEVVASWATIRDAIAQIDLDTYRRISP
jgi:hypothetical protein